MDEEEDGLPILTKKTQTPSEDPGDGLPILKKKPTNYVEKPVDEEDQQLQDFSTQQKRQLEQPFNNTSKPSEKSTPKKDESFSFLGGLKGAFDELKTAYSTPKDPKVDRPADPVVAAFKRGVASGEQADVINPFRDIQEGDAEKIAEAQKSISKNKPSAAYEKFAQSVGVSDALDAFVEDPLSITVELTTESLTAMAAHGAPIMAEKISIGGVGGAMAGSVIPGMGTAAGAIGGASSGLNVGMAQTSLDLEYAGKFLEVLQEAGVDTSDKDALKKAFENDELIDEARAQGLKKGIPVALFDLISGGMAGKFTSKPAKGIVKRVAQNLVEMGAQGGLGMGGEFTGQVVAGEKITAGSIIAEGIGEFASAPVQAAVGAKTLHNQTLSDMKEINQAAKAVDEAITPVVTQESAPVTQDVTIQPVPEDVVTQETQPVTQDEISQPTQEGTEPLGQESKTPVTDGGGQESQEPTAGTGLPPATDPEQSQEGQESPAMRDKALLNRAFKGADDPEVKASLEKHGLQYEVESFDMAKVKADDFIKEVGLENALDAVRNNRIEGAPAARIMARVIDDANEKMLTATSQDEIDKYVALQAELLSEFDVKARKGGQFSSFLQDVYATSNFNYSTEKQVSKYKEINKGKITPEAESKIRELTSTVDEYSKKIADYEKQRTQREEQDAIAAAKKDASKTKTARTKLITAEKKKEITSFFDSLKVDVSGTANDITRVVGSAVWNGSLDAVKAAVLAGADVANAVQAGVKYIQENFKGEGFVPDEYVQALQPGVEKYVPKPKEKKAAKPQVPSVNKKGNVTIPNSIITDLVEAGVDTIEELTSSIHALMKNDFPDVTERQVRDAITQYGKTRNMSQDAVKKKIRELKRVGKLVSGLEDVQRQMRPLRSGLQRDKLTDKERRMQKELKEAMKDLPVDEDEADKAWRTALDAVKSRLTNQIADLEDQIATGKKTPKKKGIEYDDEAKALQEERDRLKEIVQDAEGKSTMSDEQKTRNAILAVERRIKEVQKQISDKDIEYKKKKSGPVSQELIDKRKELRTLNDTVAKMREEAGVAEKKRLEAQKSAVKKSTEEYRRRINEGDFDKKPKKSITPDDELLELKSKQQAAKDELDTLQYKNELANRKWHQKAVDGALEAWNLTRVLRAGFEFSMVGIQGGVLNAAAILRNPKQSAQAFMALFTHFASQKKADEWAAKIKVQEFYGRMKASKLAITEPDGRITAREESFFGGWVNKIWDIAGYPWKLAGEKAYTRWKRINPTAAYERANSAFMNTLRVSRYLDGEEMLRLQGKTFAENPDDYKMMADVINTFTGRASIGQGQKIQKALSNIFFSPRNWASIIKTSSPYAFYHFGKMTSTNKTTGKPEISVAQKMAVADFARYVGLTGGFLMLVAAGGDEDDKDGYYVEMDPRSSNYLKVVKNNTTIDPWGGRTQMMIFLSRIITGEIKKKGNIENVGEGRNDNELEMAEKLVRNKLHPSLRMIVNYGDASFKKAKSGPNKGKIVRMDDFGNDVSFSKQIPENLYPMYADAALEVSQDMPAEWSSFVNFLLYFGLIQTNTYEQKPKKKEDTKIGF